MTHRTAQGFGRVLATDADIICQMDADLSHTPSYLPALVSAAGRYDVVIGSRYLCGVSVVNWPLYRIALSAAANRYVRTITRTPVADCTSGFRCWRRDALSRIPLDRLASNGYGFLIETLHEAARRGASIGEIPIIFVERRCGHSKVSFRVLVESMGDSLASSVPRPRPIAPTHRCSIRRELPRESPTARRSDVTRSSGPELSYAVGSRLPPQGFGNRR